MRVHREVGPGLDEEVYQEACERVFSAAGIRFIPQPRKWIEHRERRVKRLVPDFLVDHRVVVDLKALFGALPGASYAQIICYCKLLQTRVGLLANFGLQSLGWKRLAYTPRHDDFEVRKEKLSSPMDTTCRDLSQAVLQAIANVCSIHGPGYTEEIYRLLLKAELDHLDLRWTHGALARPMFDGRPLKQVEVPVILVEERIPVYVAALYDNLCVAHLARVKTYCRWLSLPLGLAINFGKHSCLVKEVSP
jgi:GxxExxY protein